MKKYLTVMFISHNLQSFGRVVALCALLLLALGVGGGDARPPCRCQNIPSIAPVRMDNPRISWGFGDRIDPFTGRRKFHYGLDYRGPRGTAIIATGDGIIDEIDYERYGFGWSVRIDHGHGLQTLYAHLNRRPPGKPGDHVKRGEEIGELGATGRATGPHLHYAVIENGKYTNPRRYIQNSRF